MNEEEYTEFRDAVKAMVVELGTQLDPEDDWMPALFMVNETELKVIGLDPNMLNVKPLMTQVMASIVSDANPDACAFIATGWQVDGTAEELDKANEMIESEEGLSEHPNRKECVTLSFYTPTQSEYYSAEIIRHADSPPTLEEWEGWPGEQATGLFVEPMRAAMQARLN